MCLLIYFFCLYYKLHIFDIRNIFKQQDVTSDDILHIKVIQQWKIKVFISRNLSRYVI